MDSDDQPFRQPTTIVADDAAILSLSGMARGSPAMYARRRRILSETRKLLGEVGAEGFAMRELAYRAGVSTRTLYNAFTSKEVLILAAIRQYYDKFLRALSEQNNPYDFEDMIDTIIIINLRNLQIGEYLKAVVNLYFSNSSGPEVRIELRRIAAGFMMPWLDLAQARQELRPGVAPRRVVANLAALQFTANQEYLAGDIAAHDLVSHVMEAVFTYLCGIATGATLQHVHELVDDLRGDQRIFRARVRKASARLNSLLDGDRSRAVPEIE